jgi:predicted AAA+ superfamily ATPase
MTDLKGLYLDLCMSAVFRNLLSKPLFINFERISDSALPTSERIKSYASMVNGIYEEGGSLSSLVRKLVFEDENVYIRSVAHGDRISQDLEDSVKHELEVFSRLASLTAKDFAQELGLEYVSPFDSEPCCLYYEYKEHIKDVDKHGYGVFANNTMFRLNDQGELLPIISADKTTVESFVGYRQERAKVIENTVAFIEGRPAANVLLCGDAGTGKSSTVKAVANAYFGRGIRLIELRKNQLAELPYVMGRISDNPLKFIIFIDDLSFNQNDDNFSMLKAALEGSASAKADNAVIYATSNRRHIIKESFGDRDGDDVHRNDTMQETLSLSERFGLVVLFQKPNKELYLQIVHELASRYNVKMDMAELDIKAEAFALRRGNRSARCAEQFIKSLVK